MAMTEIKFKIDEELKNDFDLLCSEKGINISDAFKNFITSNKNILLLRIKKLPSAFKNLILLTAKILKF